VKLNADALGGHLSGRLLPVYLITGDEPLLGGEAADAVRAAARAQGYTERVVHFVTPGFNWNDLTGSVNTLSLFAERRLVEIRLASARPGPAGGAALVELIATNVPDVVFLIQTPRLEREAQGAEWVRAAEKHGAWVQVWPVDAGKLPGWLAGRARRLKLQADSGVFEALAERTEGNLLAANQELEKLRLAATEGRITLDQVVAGVADSARFDTFKLLTAALEGDAPRALRILDGLRAEGVEPVLVLWALARAVRDLWNTLGDRDDSRSARWSPQGAALERGRVRAARLDYRRLSARAEQADRIVKGRAAGDAWDELALLAAELCGRPVLTAVPIGG
jgi:DNA polymerase III subunit delta